MSTPFGSNQPEKNAVVEAIEQLAIAEGAKDPELEYALRSIMEAVTYGVMLAARNFKDNRQ